ncbi:quaternary amine ABC transporter ATP-binding protein [Microbacterium thalassium]|uniref:Glycine betaine/proline transport system ATP-binding protein n=1 Tax=Microbacterium thalassium TaxID=362649 RepID=A0A7X0FMG2_9MICO|nr:glycine betaine/L-proline ABC transporter ATP-binding protein [Microbacterium thalassium]MBB6390230.1 glycine betaine/proline transport system ATP-binding protein [Microbacterium thalassium]GLK25338.1 glycine/betaine ABC transporter ATP-binding protein [Microbacterium thalassium]
MTVEVALEARNLYKIFGKNPQDVVRRLEAGESRSDVADAGTAAVIDASFTVNKGEIFVIMGLSGSGKSTIIRMLNGLNPPTEGDVVVQGNSIGEASPKELREIRQRHVSMVFQHFALLPHLSVLDNAAYGLEIQGVGKEERRARAQEILEKVGLGDRSSAMPHELSGGMQQRVGLARALTAGTDIMLMDEAFSALDPLIRREMQEQLITLQQELGRTIVFITHDLNEAMFLGDRIAVMRDGRIVQNGTPEEILTDPANDYVAQFVQDVDRARVLTAASVMEQPTAVSTLHAGVRGALKVMRDRQASSVSIVENLKFVGAVTDRSVIRAVKEGRTDLRSLIENVQPTVHPDDPLTEVVDRSVESHVPVAVVDSTDRLVGVIPRVTLLAALGNVAPETRSIPIVDTVPAASAQELDLTLAAVGGGEAAVPAEAATEGGV